VKCWGNNHSGQLGDGTTTDRLSPTVVPYLTDVAQISAGNLSTCARLTDGTVKCWGTNARGELGDGTTTDHPSPASVPNLTRVVQIAVGGDHVCARLDATLGKAVKCWGDNLSYQIGQGTSPAPAFVTTPTLIANLYDVEKLGAGSEHTCALLEDATVRCWGANSRRQLGPPTTLPKSATPVQVPFTGDALDLAVGWRHGCVRFAGGSMTCWGANGAAQCGNGATSNDLGPSTSVLIAAQTPLVDVVAMAAGDQHTCAKRVDGAVLCWGSNARGQLGDGTKTDRKTAVLVTW
jgi:alpha-tubulin suppressor-like RCC1 family protein